MNFVVYEETTGRIIMSGSATTVEGLAPPGHAVMETESPVDFTAYAVRSGSVVPMPSKPIGFFTFDHASFEWVADVTKADVHVRQQRSQLLAQSDWTQLPDVPLATKEAWAVYRQALRDITEQPGYPLDVVWPSPPA